MPNPPLTVAPMLITTVSPKEKIQKKGDASPKIRSPTTQPRHASRDRPLSVMTRKEAIRHTMISVLIALLQYSPYPVKHGVELAPHVMERICASPLVTMSEGKG